MVFQKFQKKNDYTIVRPLLKYTKEELLKYNVQNNIPYQIDSSNDKDVYTRNRIRKNILPFLKKEHRNVHLKFLKLSQELEQMERFIQKEAQKEKEVRFCSNILDISC